MSAVLEVLSVFVVVFIVIVVVGAIFGALAYFRLIRCTRSPEDPPRHIPKLVATEKYTDSSGKQKERHMYRCKYCGKTM